nr:putative acetyltransferase A, auxiliary subunit [Ipomoea batatas]
MLHTEPSFAIYNSDEGLPGEIRNGDSVAEAMGEFSFGKGMGMIDEKDGEGENEEKDEGLDGFKDLGLGIDGDGEIENYCKMMVEENPSNPLFLRKYAQLLQAKGDLSGAEEHYFLATLADPKDGATLMQYAKLVWELYHDKDRAYSYFKRAVLAAPQDSHVLGAYASFLWEIDDGDDQSNEDLQGDEQYSGAILADHRSDGEIISEYANFIWQLHHDKDKASSYFKRALQASPEDSNALAAYASFLWQIEEDDEDAASE